METMVLERYIQNAEKAFEQNEYMEGMRLLEEALTIEPNYGKAHNHLGWLYLFQINDWTKAETHLRMALKYSPAYGPAYIHMSHMLFEQRKFDELTKLLENALKVGGVQKSFVYNEYGRIAEVSGNFNKAVRYYKTAIRWSFGEQEIGVYRDNIRRCRDKRWIMMF
jgi:tetratricopeptide (TPR) repeat protein